MEERKRNRYSQEYKRDVVGMIEEKGIPIKVVAKDMGVRVDLLYSWKRKYGKGVKESEGRNNLAEIKRLQKRLLEVEEERDILKKAVAIFTQEPKRGTNS